MINGYTLLGMELASRDILESWRDITVSHDIPRGCDHIPASWRDILESKNKTCIYEI